MNSNYLLLTQLLIDYALKSQEIAQLFQKATLENRDVSDEEVMASSVRRDAAIALANSIKRNG